MKILFLGTCSVGPFYIMNYLKQRGHEVKGCYMGVDELILGEPAQPFSPPINMEAIISFNPDIIGISTDTANFAKTAQIVSRVKARLPSVLIGLGGIHPTIRPQQSIEMPGVDFICEGEGELSLHELITRLEKKEPYTDIQSLWFKTEDGHVIKNPMRPWHENLDDFQIDRYEVEYSGVFTGMGCKGRCTFCSTPMLMFEKGQGKYYRKRSVDSILDEIGHIFRGRIKRIFPKLKIRGFKRLKQTLWKDIFAPVHIKDDSFLISKSWLLDFCDKYRKRFWFLPFACLGRADEIDEEIADALGKAGCKRVVIGFEHGDEEFRNKILFKKCTDQQIYDARKYLNKNRITINGQWIIGFPGETVEQALKTLKLASEVDDMPQIHIAQPYPATVMFDMAVKQGYITEDYVADKGIYADFLFHKGPERDALRLIYNMFPIGSVRIPKSTRLLGRFHEHAGKTIAENLVRSFDTHKVIEVDHDKEEETRRRAMSYRRSAQTG